MNYWPESNGKGRRTHPCVFNLNVFIQGNNFEKLHKPRWMCLMRVLFLAAAIEGVAVIYHLQIKFIIIALFTFDCYYSSLANLKVTGNWTLRKCSSPILSASNLSTVQLALTISIRSHLGRKIRLLTWTEDRQTLGWRLGNSCQLNFYCCWTNWSFCFKLFSNGRSVLLISFLLWVTPHLYSTRSQSPCSLF